MSETTIESDVDNSKRIEITPPNSTNEATFKGYQGIFTLGDGSSQVPKWLPVSLLALTTAALAVPIIVLRRQRATAARKALADAPAPPPRRTLSGDTFLAPRRAAFSTVNAPPPRRAPVDAPPPRRASAVVSIAPVVAPRPPSSSPPSPPPIPDGPQASRSAEDNFNGALYTMKAFGLATFMVLTGAGTAVWGTKTALGVQDTQEFANRMRTFIMQRMPRLSKQIHRPPQLEDRDSDAPHSLAPRIEAEPGNDALKWSWPDAEKRLSAAFERDGFMGWAEAALKELEAEGQAERIRKGHV